MMHVGVKQRAVSIIVLLLLIAALRPGPVHGEVLTLGRWDNGLWYPGEEENEDGGQVVFRFADGDTKMLQRDEVVRYAVGQGTRVYVDALGDGEYVAGRVVEIDDEYVQVEVATEVVRAGLDEICFRHPEAFAPGLDVLVLDGDYWRPAEVVDTDDSRCRVRYATGEVAWVGEEQVATRNLVAGDEVEGNWLGLGIFMEGELVQIRGRRLTIQYEDGDVETTTLSAIRVPDF